jgi:hypothetical protein
MSALPSHLDKVSFLRELLPWKKLGLSFGKG